MIDTGILISIQGKGLCLNRTHINTAYRILLGLNKISNYKKQIYNALLQTLGNKAMVEIKVHHSNVLLLDVYISGHAKEFDYILIMPHFYEDYAKALEIIRKILKEKMIFLKKDMPELPSFVSVFQDFKKDISYALKSALQATF